MGHLKIRKLNCRDTEIRSSENHNLVNRVPGKLNLEMGKFERWYSEIGISQIQNPTNRKLKILNREEPWTKLEAGETSGGRPGGTNRCG